MAGPGRAPRSLVDTARRCADGLAVIVLTAVEQGGWLAMGGWREHAGGATELGAAFAAVCGARAAVHYLVLAASCATYFAL